VATRRGFALVLGPHILASLILGPGQVLEVTVRNTSAGDLRVVAGVTGTVEVPG
jgi:archaellum component FlaG (FlaF/FlaG flagellin family)